MQDFSFETQELSSSSIEEAICNSCGLQNVSSSNLPWFIDAEVMYLVTVTAQNGSVSCKVIAYKSTKSEGCYIVCVSNIKVNSR